MTNWREDDDPEDGELKPGDPDYDLSEAHPYSWEPRRTGAAIPTPAAIFITVLVIAALIVPSVLIILRYG
jgi:hypothetical protein